MELSEQLNATFGKPDFDRRDQWMCGEVVSRLLHGIAVVRAFHYLSRPNFALTVEQVTVVVGHAHPPPKNPRPGYDITVAQYCQGWRRGGGCAGTGCRLRCILWAILSLNTFPRKQIEQGRVE